MLVSSASNVAVDNLGERLLKEGLNVVRLGHPARVAETMQSVSLSLLVKEIRDKLEKIKSEVDELKEKRLKKGKKLRPEDKKVLEVQLKSLMKQRDKCSRALGKLMGDHLKKADVVLSTLTGCRSKGPLENLPEDHFNLTVIDECGQAMEMACWLAIHRSPKLILAGDHLQLPPTVISKKAEKKLSISLMERLRERFFYGSGISSTFHMLNVG